MAEPTYTLAVEFTAGSYTNITSHCLQAQVERQLSTLFEQPREGLALFSLANERGRFSPLNSASPYYPNLVPGKQLRFRATGKTNYLSLPGEAGDYASTPSAPANNITSGAITMSAKVRPNSMPPAAAEVVVGKWGPGSRCSGRPWRFPVCVFEAECRLPWVLP